MTQTRPTISNVEAERAYLACLLSAPWLLEKAAALSPAHFHDRRHAALFTILKELYSRDPTILDFDHTILKDRLQRISLVQESNWGVYLNEVLASPGDLGRAGDYQDIIVDLAHRRTRLAELTAEAKVLLDPTTPALTPATEEDALSRFRLEGAADFLQPQPAPEWLVDGLISKGTVSMWYGEPGSKKTYSLFSMLVCVATGKPWLERATHPCPVLVVDEESGRVRLARRMGETLRGALCDGSGPIYATSLNGIKLSNQADVQDLSALIRSRGIGLVLVDSLAAVMDGDENSKQDMQPVMSAVRKLADDTGAAFVLIHHSGKNGKYRGSSASKASTDQMIHVMSEEGSPFIHFKTDKNRDGEMAAFSARATWVRGARDGDQFFLEAAGAAPVLGGEGVGQGGAAAERGPTCQQLIVRHLEQAGSASMKEIQAALEGQRKAGAVQDTVYELQRKGVLCRANEGKQGTAAIYQLGNLEGTMKGQNLELGIGGTL